MTINLDNDWKFGVFYSNDTATTIDFISKILGYSCEKDINIVIVDANHIVTPDVLIGFPEECLKNILLIKPSSVSAVGHILDKLITSKENKNKIILVISLFIQIPFDVWAAYNYDPLYILYGLKNKVDSGEELKTIITIDTQMEEKGLIAYRDIINEVADWVLTGFQKDNKTIIKRVK